MDVAENSGIWLSILQWIGVYRIGDLASIAGVLISIIGFAVTVRGVVRSKHAAQRAEEAARSTRDKMRLLETVVDFSAAITTLEEIKRMHRTRQWVLLPERYAALRKLLVTVRTTSPDLTQSQKAAIQNALTNLHDLETAVERSLTNPAILRPAKFNAVIARDIDDLVATLAEIKSAKAEE